MRCRAANSCTSTCCARTVSSSSSSRENSGTCRSSSTLHGMAEVLATQLSEEVRKEGLGSQVPLSSCHPRTRGPRPACWLGWSSRGPRPACSWGGAAGGKGICLCSALAFVFLVCHPRSRGPRPACWLGWSSRGGKGICLCSCFSSCHPRRGSAFALLLPLSFLFVIPAGDLRLPLPYPLPPTPPPPTPPGSHQKHPPPRTP